jgi:membrane associated rhomboid family serine protease
MAGDPESAATMVLLPLYDNDPLEGKTRPYVTYGLIAVNISIAIFTFSLPRESYHLLLHTVGLIPASETRELPGMGLFPRDLALLTSMFLHADWQHLLFNMLFLWIFGDNIEDAIGHLRFLIFYVLCGLVGGIAYVVSVPHGTMPLIGASGAIAGVLTAYLMIRPCARIQVLVFVVPIPAPAYLVIGAWLVTQIWHIEMHASSQVAYWCHIGGAIAGALLILVVRPPHIELFECMSPSAVPAAGASASPRPPPLDR